MIKETEAELKKMIHDALEGMWDDDDNNNILSTITFGDETLYLMAEAAANVLIATVDVREYLREQKMKP